MNECPNCKEIGDLRKDIEALKDTVYGEYERGPAQVGLVTRVGVLEADKKNIASLLRWLLIALGGMGMAFLQSFLPTPKAH